MLKRNSIFMKFFIVVLVATIIISGVLTLAASQISERILLEQTKQNATVNLRLVKDELLKYNEQIVNTMVQINTSDAFKQYLTRPAESTLDRLNIIIELGRYIETYKDYLSPDNTHFIVSGIGANQNRNYSSNALKWDQIPPNIVEDFMTEDGLVAQKVLYHGSQHLFADTVPYERYIFATKPLMDRRTMYGYAIVIMDEQTIYNRYSSYLTPGSRISLVSAGGYALSSSERELTSTQQPELLEHAAIANTESYYGMKTKDGYTYISLYIPEFDAYLLQEINQRVAFAPLQQIAIRIVQVVLVLSVAIMVAVYVITRRISKPLYELVDTMQSSRIDALQPHPLQENTSYEVKVVTKTYNHLVKEIDNYTKQVVFEQNERRKADLNALQMQINPHFLYNTLTSIKYLAKMNRIDDVDRTITSLSAMLQNTIGKTEDTISVHSEIESLKHYVYINQIRYGEQIQVHFDVQPDCLELLVPKLIIQPFVENAFFHAFPGVAKGNIYVFVRQQEDRLLIEVLDDGVGSQAAAQKKIKRPVSGIGIENVHHRIVLLHGPKYGVTMNSSEYGTAVKISLPILQNISIE
ncbi:histidine kinase [Paenibacillus montaniterrae]|uniref:Histidine kinase n=1 Tax=Paenibacillus montaniterrae TaxID=429341 RepID=A0A919YUK4_9BACL|nr:sensor histidine kinase [Paenibacillus montaniterrae]GIP18766.1 histidine kinase [Paenibacillus montaniterrae]